MMMGLFEQVKFVVSDHLVCVCVCVVEKRNIGPL